MKKVWKALLIILIVTLCLAVTGVLLFFGIMFMGIFSACQSSGTVFFEDDTIPSASLLPTSENDRYVLFSHGEYYLYDTQENKQTVLEQIPLTDVYDTLLLEDHMEKHCFISIPIYDKQTGQIDHTEYYQTVVLISYETGAEYDRIVSDDPMTEEEKNELLSQKEEEEEENDPKYKGIEQISSFTLTNSSRYYRTEKPLDPASLNPTERAIYDYVYDLCEIKEVGFYWGDARCRNTKDGIYFFVTLCNKKNFSGQRPVLSGLQKSLLVKYDEETQSFTTLLELKKGCVILGFDDTHALFYDNGALYSIEISTGNRTKIRSIGNNIHAAGSDDFVILSEYSESYHFLVLTYDGRLLCEWESAD